MAVHYDEILIVSDNGKKISTLTDAISGKTQDLKLHSNKDLNGAIESILDNNRIDLVIIDNDSKAFSGIELLRKIKRIKPKLGVLMLAGKITKELSLKALGSGAYNLLSFDKESDALTNNIRGYFHGLQNDRLNVEIIRFLVEGKSIYKIPNSLKYVQVVSNHITRDLPQVGIVDEGHVENIKFGLQEILINAIEHGNLEISFDQKTKLLKKGMDLSKIIDKYSHLKKFSQRHVVIEYTLTKEKAIYVIKDEGKGFDWKALGVFSKTNDPLLEHGRGIIMAKKYFDEFYFNAKGNEASLIVFRKARKV
jgi:anti-sigma regulatory factor (Ser/Thr protein kinase)